MVSGTGMSSPESTATFSAYPPPGVWAKNTAVELGTSATRRHFREGEVSQVKEKGENRLEAERQGEHETTKRRREHTWPTRNQRKGGDVVCVCVWKVMIWQFQAAPPPVTLAQGAEQGIVTIPSQA
jgi:hypothetical protein